MPKFDPQLLTASAPRFSLPLELWLSILSHPCAFPTAIFSRVMENLIRNPNISSSHLFRADVFYDSEKHGDAQELGRSDFTRHLKAGLQPRSCQVPDSWVWSRTIVRRLVPRNPNVDKDLVQTVHLFRQGGSSAQGQDEGMLVMQIPHVEREEDMPWYHPAVMQLAIIHTWRPASGHSQGAKISQATPPMGQGTGELSIHYRFFPNNGDGGDHINDQATRQRLTDRLARTAHNILSTIHRHGEGQLAGYTKRVHHDQIIPQPAFQDTYTRLKLTYAKPLIASWAEQTDPTKHVFEDLGIAAFLIELWRGMYAAAAFPGFVDVGCGNGVLVHVLWQEGYAGWGFDARRRKSWVTFPEEVQRSLVELLLVPRMLQVAATPSHVAEGEGETEHQNKQRQGPGQDGAARADRPAWHDGVFKEGVFIVSNHADELTPWTPVLASLSRSPFISIPCCSHSFSGARYRAPVVPSVFGDDAPSRIDADAVAQAGPGDASKTPPPPERGKGHASGSLKGPKGPSAYATLTNWVAKLALDVGYVPEKEMLRIPSTRNAAVVCRQLGDSLRHSSSLEDRERKARQLVEDSLGGQQSMEEASREWLKRATKLHGKTSDAH